jgi:hypothetical protein
LFSVTLVATYRFTGGRATTDTGPGAALPPATVVPGELAFAVVVVTLPETGIAWVPSFPGIVPIADPPKVVVVDPVWGTAPEACVPPCPPWEERLFDPPPLVAKEPVEGGEAARCL